MWTGPKAKRILQDRCTSLKRSTDNSETKSVDHALLKSKFLRSMMFPKEATIAQQSTCPNVQQSVYSNIDTKSLKSEGAEPLTENWLELTLRTTEVLQCSENEEETLPTNSTIASNEKEKDQIEFWARTLLNLVDNISLDHLESNLDKSEDIKEFVAVCLQILIPKASESIQSLYSVDYGWTRLIQPIMSMAKVKRTDQKLRMFFNTILKKVISEESTREMQFFHVKCKRIPQYRNRYDHDLLETMVSIGKAPSRKKLIRFFGLVPDVRDRFIEILEGKEFINSLLKKRETKSKRIVIEYLALRRRFAHQQQNIPHILDMSIKTFPWSRAELESGCKTLLSIIRQSILTPIQLSDSVKCDEVHLNQSQRSLICIEPSPLTSPKSHPPIHRTQTQLKPIFDSNQVFSSSIPHEQSDYSFIFIHLSSF